MLKLKFNGYINDFILTKLGLTCGILFAEVYLFNLLYRSSLFRDIQIELHDTDNDQRVCRHFITDN